MPPPAAAREPAGSGSNDATAPDTLKRCVYTRASTVLELSTCTSTSAGGIAAEAVRPGPRRRHWGLLAQGAVVPAERTRTHASCERAVTVCVGAHMCMGLRVRWRLSAGH